MINHWLILGAVLAGLVGSYQWGAHNTDARWSARINKDRADASEAARTKERMWQEVVNGTVRNYEDQKRGIERNLDAAVGELRRRPQRAAAVPGVARPDCAGGSGAELSGADAEFLAREAARADGIRAGLVACHAVIDGVRQ